MRKVIPIFLISLLGLIFLVFLGLNLPVTQKFATKKVNGILHTSGIPVQIEAIGKLMPNSVKVHGILIAGPAGDTIIYVDEVDASIRLVSLLRSKLRVKDLSLHGIAVQLLMNEMTGVLNIAEAFQTGNKEKSQGPPGKAWTISLRSAHISELDFRMLDSLSGLFMHQGIEELELKNTQLQLVERIIEARSLALNGARGKIIVHPGIAPKKKAEGNPWNFEILDLKVENTEFSYQVPSDTLYFSTSIGELDMKARAMNLAERKLDIKKLRLVQSKAILQNTALSNELKSFIHQADPSFDSMLSLNLIDLDIRNILYNPDRVGIEIKTLQARMDHGFSIEEFRGELESDPSHTRLAFILQSGGSRLNLEGRAGKALGSLIASPTDIGDASLEIRESTLSPGDLTRFLPALELSPYYQRFSLSPVRMEGLLELSGNVLKISRLNIQQDKTFRLQTEASLVNPFEFSVAVIEGNIRLSGFAGNADFSGSANLKTGNISLNSDFRKLDLGQLLQVPELGTFDGSALISGHGFREDSLHADFTLKVDRLQYGGKPYGPALLSGTIQPGLYKGEAEINDPIVQGMIRAFVYPSDSLTRISLGGQLMANLDQLGAIKDPTTIESGFEGTTSISKGILSSDLVATHLTLSTPGNAIEFDHINASFYSDSTLIRAHADGDFFNVDLSMGTGYREIGKFTEDFKTYVASFRDSIHIQPERGDFDFPEIQAEFQFSYHPLYELITQDTGIHFDQIDVSLANHSLENRMDCQVNAQDISLGPVKAEDLKLSLTDSAGNLAVRMLAGQTTLGDGPPRRWALAGDYLGRELQSELSITGQDGDVAYGISIAGELDQQVIDLRVPSEKVILKGLPWKIEPSRFMSIHTDSLSLHPDFSLRSGSSQIRLFTIKEETHQSLILELDSVSFISLMRADLLPGEPRGLLSGKIDLQQGDHGKRNILAKLRVKELRYAGVDFSTMNMDAALALQEPGLMDLDIHLDMDTTSLTIHGERGTPDQLILQSEFERFPIKILEPFTRKQLSRLRGSISGDFNYSSSSSSTDYMGDILFTDAGLRINALNNAFRIPDQRLQFDKGMIRFDDFRVLDTLNKALTVNGYIDAGNKGAVQLNLDVSSDNLKVMSRNAATKAPFSGNIFVDSRFSIRGPLTKPRIEGNIVLSKGTQIYYQLQEDLSVSDRDKIITFVDHSSTPDQARTVLPYSYGSMRKSSIETHIEIDPTTLLNFQVSRRIYDLQLQIKGGGSLNYNLLDNNQMQLAGRYEIREGYALLNLTGWSEKSFSISEGGYVRWDGRIEEPELNLEAVKQVKTSYINPVDGQRREVELNVALQMSNYLSDLDVLFTIRTPDQYIMSVINTLSPEEQMYQAVSVLLFETIDLPGISSSTDYMTQKVNQIVSAQLNQLTKTSIKGVDISFGLDSYNQPFEGGGDQTRTNLTYQVSKSMLNNSAQFELSGSLRDVNQQPGASDVSLHNISFEYRLDSSATKYLKVYNKKTYDDVFDGEVMKTGVGFSYRKKYRSIADMFRKKEEE